MPTFCRHNRLLQNCPICTKEQNLEMRPAVTRFGEPEREQRGAPSSRPDARKQAGGSRGRTASGGMTVRRLARDAGDGFRSGLVPGIKSGAEAQRLADELAFASARCRLLADDPPGLYAEVADPSADLEERTWLAFTIAWLSPLESGSGSGDPFASIAAARIDWNPDGDTGPDPALVQAGPRGTFDAADPARTANAYRGWARRAGSQAAAFAGDPSWTPERRFDRVYERLSVHGADRAVRFDLLVTLGATGVYDLRAGSLHLGGSDPVTVAAKRILGIGDQLLLERRAADLAQACEAPLEALDLGFFNWERRRRWGAGIDPATPVDQTVRAAAQRAFGIEAEVADSE